MKTLNEEEMRKVSNTTNNLNVNRNYSFSDYKNALLTQKFTLLQEMAKRAESVCNIPKYTR